MRFSGTGSISKIGQLTLKRRFQSGASANTQKSQFAEYEAELPDLHGFSGDYSYHNIPFIPASGLLPPDMNQLRLG